MRAMLDSMVTDDLLARPDVFDLADALVGTGHLTLLTTHVQRDQVSQTPDEPKRVALLVVQQRFTRIPTQGFVWDLSNWDEGTWGSPETGERIVALAGGSANHMADALIAVTAEAQADVLVTNDKGMQKRAEKLNLAKPIWDFEEFTRWISAQSQPLKQ